MKINSDVIRILNMFKADKIDINEATQLLDTIEVRDPDLEETRWMNIILKILDTDDELVNIHVPLNLFKKGLRMGARISLGRSLKDLHEDFDDVLSYAETDPDFLDENGRGVVVGLEEYDYNEWAYITLE
ncbi:MAG: hypothetical protein GX603_03620 [Chloroflexi bacterium]|nr:hypothetical protein [Chloroflexota bacterium]